MIGYLAFAQHWITKTSLLQLFLELSISDFLGRAKHCQNVTVNPLGEVHISVVLGRIEIHKLCEGPMSL